MCHEGAFGDCPWLIDDSGVLHLGPGQMAEPSTDELQPGQTLAFAYPWHRHANDVRLIAVEPDTTAPRDASCLFDGLGQVRAAAVRELDTSTTQCMSHLFANCDRLEAIDLGPWDTSQVTSMAYLFANDRRLHLVDLARWDTSKVRSMSGLFSGCSSLTVVDINHWDRSRVGTVDHMFDNCPVGAKMAEGLFMLQGRMNEEASKARQSVRKLADMPTDFVGYESWLDL